MGKLKDLFQSLVADGGLDKAEEIEKILPEFEAELDELDAIVADGLDWDDADEILGDVLPDVLKLVRKHTKDASAKEIEEVGYNMMLLLKHHYKWDIPWVPSSIEDMLLRKIIAVAFKALTKDQKDPETDSANVAA